MTITLSSVWLSVSAAHFAATVCSSNSWALMHCNINLKTFVCFKRGDASTKIRQIQQTTSSTLIKY